VSVNKALVRKVNNMKVNKNFTNLKVHMITNKIKNKFKKEMSKK